MIYECVIEYLDGKKETLSSSDIISYGLLGGRVSVSGVNPPETDLAMMVGEGHPILVSTGNLSSEIGRIIPVRENVRHVSFEEKELRAVS